MKYEKIFLVGFPKSGTKTIHKALSLSGFSSAHWKVKEGFVGELIYRGFHKYNDPWYFLSDYRAISQADVCITKKQMEINLKENPKLISYLNQEYGGILNFWPNLDFLIIKRIQEKYPKCLFVLNYRDPSKIISSIVRWKDLQSRLKNSEIAGLPLDKGSEKDLYKWISDHFEKVRTYFKNYDNFLEIDIESEQAPVELSNKIGMPIVWWGVENKNEKNPSSQV